MEKVENVGNTFSRATLGVKAEITSGRLHGPRYPLVGCAGGRIKPGAVIEQVVEICCTLFHQIKIYLLVVKIDTCHLHLNPAGESISFTGSFSLHTVADSIVVIIIIG